MKNKVNDKQEENLRKTKLSSSIMLAVQLDSAFKLYSFHIINPEDYIGRIDELVEQYKSQIKKAHVENIQVNP